MPVIAKKVPKKVPNPIKGLPDETVMVTEYVEAQASVDPPSIDQLLGGLKGTLSKKQQDKIKAEWSKIVNDKVQPKVEKYRAKV